VIGFAYVGYLAGLFVSLRATRIRQALGSEARVYLAGAVLYGGGLGLFALPSIGGVYLAMFVFCGGMFLLHTRLSGEVNHLAHEHKGVANGIYIAAYYLGGALGSWLPAELYRHLGWSVFLWILGGVLLLAAASLGRLQRLLHADAG
jgi:YNFM family putative membrane transporter